MSKRLRNSTLLKNTQHPILLPNSSTLTTLLIRHIYTMYFHAGSQLMWSILSRKYWILSNRSAIRKVVFKCVILYYIILYIYILSKNFSTHHGRSHSFSCNFISSICPCWSRLCWAIIYKRKSSQEFSCCKMLFVNFCVNGC